MTVKSVTRVEHITAASSPESSPEIIVVIVRDHASNLIIKKIV